MRRRLLVIGGTAVLLLVALLAALPYIIDVNRYRDRLQAAIGESLGRQVSLGDMRLSVWPVGLRVRDAVVADSPAFQAERPFVQVAELYVSPKILPLFAGRFELRALELRRPTVELVQNRTGTWNVSTLGSGRGANDGGRPQLVLDELTLTDGQLGVTTPGDNGSTRSVYDNIDVRVAGFGPDRAFDLQLAATMPSGESERVTLRGTAGPLTSDAARTPFEGAIDLERVSIAGLQRFLGAQALAGTDGRVSGRADVRSGEGTLASAGALRLEAARIRGVELGYPVAADFDVAYDIPRQLLTLRKAVLELDRTPLSATGTVDLQPPSAVLDVRATASKASLAEAARLAAASGVVFGAEMTVEGVLDADVRATGNASAPALQGTVQLRDVRIAGPDIPQPVRTPAVLLQLTPAEIRTGDIAVTAGATTVQARASLRDYTTERPLLDAGLRTKQADLAELLNMARAWGVAAGDVRGSGRVSVDAQAAGPLAALIYSGAGTLTEASISSAALTEPLQIRRADLSFRRDAAVIETPGISIGGTVANGRVSIRRFASPQVDFDLAADRIDVARLQGVVRETTTSAPSGQSDGSVLRRTSGKGRLRVGTIVYDALVLEDVQTDVTLDHGVIRMDPLSAGLFGGRHRGTVVADARQTPMRVEVDSDLQRVDANRLASAATNVRDVIFGALGTRARLAFAGADAGGIASSLTGTMSINLSDGRIANMNLMQEIGNIARFVTGGSPTERSTRVASLSGTFDVKNGLARTRDLVGAIEGGSIGAEGTVNLVDNGLDLRLTAVLSREYTERVGATRAGGFMTTALANQQGELVIPFTVGGTLQAPRFSPDASRMADMRVKNLVPSLKNPNATTSAILGAISGRRDPDAPRPGVGDIIGAITGRGAEATPPAQDPKPDAATAPAAAPDQPAAPPDRGRQIEDALRGLLRGRKPPPAEPKPTEPAGEATKPTQ